MLSIHRKRAERRRSRKQNVADSSADVTIVIPQYNYPELTSACIQSIRVNEAKLWPIVVVDDGSTQESRLFFESGSFSETRLIEQKHSGVSSAWNRGAAAADYPFLVFLNNDVLFSGPVIERLVGPLRNGKTLITGIAMRKEAALSPPILKDLPTDRFLEGWCFAIAAETFRSLVLQSHIVLFSGRTTGLVVASFCRCLMPSSPV